MSFIGSSILFSPLGIEGRSRNSPSYRLREGTSAAFCSKRDSIRQEGELICATPRVGEDHGPAQRCDLKRQQIVVADPVGNYNDVRGG